MVSPRSCLFRLLVLVLVQSAWPGFSAVRAAAAEPASMQALSHKQFAEWMKGTEWSFTDGAGRKRRIWFAADGQALYTRVGETGGTAVMLCPWEASARGQLRVTQMDGRKQPAVLTITVNHDLKSAALDRPGVAPVSMVREERRRFAPPERMPAEGFADWLKGIRIRYGEGDTAEFQSEGRIRLTGPKASWNFKYGVLQPGLVRYFWAEDPIDPTLLEFSPDLKSVRMYVWYGTRTGKIEPLAAPPPPADAGADGRVTLESLKEVPLAARASAVKALLVQDLGNSRMAGSASVLSVSALPLEGDRPASLSFNQEVGKSMRQALREVARYCALRHGGWPRAHEMQLSFADKYTGKDGPSAAAACALLLESLYTGVKLDGDFAITGDLNVDGSIQPVGGVQAKLRGATRLKCSLLGIPARNEVQAVDIALMEGVRPFMAVQVFSLTNFDDALAVGRADKAEETAAAIRDFAALMKSADGNLRALRGAAPQEVLRSVLKRVPAHFSARLLLQASAGRLPRTLSPAGTLAEVDQAVGTLKTAVDGDLTASNRLDKGQVASARGALVRLRPLADPRVRPLLDAWTDWGNLADQVIRSGRVAERDMKSLVLAGGRISVEEEKLRSNEAFREALE